MLFKLFFIIPAVLALSNDCKKLDSIISTATNGELNVASNCCLQSGVECNDFGHITTFDYQEYCNDCMVKLSGNVESMDWQRLRYLTSLNLNNNRLYGQFPSWVAETSLEKLSLANNLLSGQLPSNLLDTKLKVLDVSGNGFSGNLPRFTNDDFELMYDNNYFEDYEDKYSNLQIQATKTKRTKIQDRLLPRQTSPVPPPSPSSGLSGGAIAGIVIGSIAGVALLGGLLYYFLRKPSKQTTYGGDVTSMGAAASVAQNPPTAYQQQYAQPVAMQAVQPAIVPVTATAALSSSSSGSRRRTGYPETGAPLSPADANNLVGKNAVAVRPYVPQLNDEMVLNKGDKVILKQVFDDGWALASNNLTKVEGLVPLACLMRTD